MISKELVNYLKQALARGLGEEQIRKDLATFGWSSQDIEEHFKELRKEIPDLTPRRKDSMSNLEKTVQKFQGLPEIVKSRKQSKFLLILITIAIIIIVVGIFLSLKP